jgi:hypothetical protein
MADEQYRWLDRDTAERLLRGESLEAVDRPTRDQADRLAKPSARCPWTPPTAKDANSRARKPRWPPSARRRAPATMSSGPPSAGAAAFPVPPTPGSSGSAGPPRPSRAPRWGRPCGTDCRRARRGDDRRGRRGRDLRRPADAVRTTNRNPPPPLRRRHPGPPARLALAERHGRRPGPRPRRRAAVPATPPARPPRNAARTRAPARSGDDKSEGRLRQVVARLTSSCRAVRDGKNLDSGRKRPGGRGGRRPQCGRTARASSRTGTAPTPVTAGAARRTGQSARAARAGTGCDGRTAGRRQGRRPRRRGGDGSDIGPGVLPGGQARPSMTARQRRQASGPARCGRRHGPRPGRRHARPLGQGPARHRPRTESTGRPRRTRPDPAPRTRAPTYRAPEQGARAPRPPDRDLHFSDSWNGSAAGV